MVGGPADVVGRLQPLFEVMGKTIIHQGPAGAGQHTKMCKQIVIASTIMGVSEGIAYAKKSGLNPDPVLKSIGGGAASGFQLTVMGAKMIAGDFAPGFYIEHFIKDLGIALAEAERMNLDLPGLSQARKLFVGLADKGLGRLGTQALIQHYGV